MEAKEAISRAQDWHHALTEHLFHELEGPKDEEALAEVLRLAKLGGAVETMPFPGALQRHAKQDWQFTEYDSEIDGSRFNQTAARSALEAIEAANE